jgi:pSer/pThr/pTyr-binding forkhead associated (FHA) protein
MRANIVLKVKEGRLAGKTFRFTDRKVCLVGRAEDCGVRLPNAGEYGTVSRHHCVLDIDPPEVRVGDFGSLNGTYINGVRVRPHGHWHSPEEAAAMPLGDHVLRDGDELALGGATFEIHITPPAARAEVRARRTTEGAPL